MTSTKTFEAELEPLVVAGVAGFDPGGLHTIRRLIEALATVPEPARSRLAARVVVHVARLRDRFEARTRALSEEIARRPEGGRNQPRRMAAARFRSRLEAALVERRLSTSPPEGSSIAAAVDPLELSHRLYRESVADALTELEARRASAPPPETTGIYHGQTIAARAVEAMDALHRPYLKAQLARLEVFAALEAFVGHVGANSK